MRESSSRFQRYLLQWLAVVLVALSLVAGTNYVIDPYGMFDSVRIEGLNKIKPAAASHVRQVKPYQVARYAPRTVIGGTSRPEIGLNPANTCWPEEYRPVFNLALPGASVGMQAMILQHAIAVSRVSHVIWGLDFLDFLGKPAKSAHVSRWPPVQREFEDRLKVNAEGSDNSVHAVQRLEDYYRATFSLDTLKDSLGTIARQARRHTSTIRRDGFNPALDYLEIIKWEGQGVLFEQKNRELAVMLERPGLASHGDEDLWSGHYETVRRLLQFGQDHGIETVLFINPYHLDYLIAIDRAGRWRQFEKWKSRLASLAGDFGVTLWDFSITNEFTTEKVPAPDDKETILNWFWEPAHYRKEYGDLMLGTMLGLPCGKPEGKSVGYPLTPENIKSRIVESRSGFLHHKENNASSDKGQLPLDLLDVR